MNKSLENAKVAVIERFRRENEIGYDVMTTDNSYVSKIDPIKGRREKMLGFIGVFLAKEDKKFDNDVVEIINSINDIKVTESDSAYDYTMSIDAGYFVTGNSVVKKLGRDRSHLVKLCNMAEKADLFLKRVHRNNKELISRRLEDC